MVSVDKQVAASGDDGWIRSDGYFYTTTSVIDLGSYGLTYDIHGFFRFTGVTITGRVIASYIQLYGNVAKTGTPLWKVCAVDADNHPAPTSYTGFEADALTTAQVDWDGGVPSVDWGTSPSLNTIFTELLASRPISNVAIIIQVRDDDASIGNHQAVRTWDYPGHAHSAKLHIEYAPVTVLWGMAALSASGTLTASGRKLTKGYAVLSSGGSLVAAGRKVLKAIAVLSAVGSMVVVGRRLLRGTAVLSATTYLAAIGKCAMGGRAILSSIGTLLATATRSIVRSHISCEDADNSAQITTHADLHSRTRTALIDWDNIPDWTKWAKYPTPSLAPAVQTVLNRPGWESGNAITAFWEDWEDDSDPVPGACREAYSASAAIETYRPLLHIEYHYRNLLLRVFKTLTESIALRDATISWLSVMWLELTETISLTASLGFTWKKTLTEVLFLAQTYRNKTSKVLTEATHLSDPIGLIRKKILAEVITLTDVRKLKTSKVLVEAIHLADYFIPAINRILFIARRFITNRAVAMRFKPMRSVEVGFNTELKIDVWFENRE